MISLKKKQIEALGFRSSAKFSEIEIKKLSIDSRTIKKATAFVSLDGTSNQGKDYVFEAIQARCAAVFVNAKYKKEIEKHEDFDTNLPIFFAKNFDSAVAELVATFYDHPSRKLTVYAITGTNGKTTIAKSIYECLMGLKHKAAYIGPLGAYIANDQIDLSHTTPHLVELTELVAKAVKKKVKTVILEASSHGIVQNRLGAIEIDGAIFTNLTQDHLDYHETMIDYFNAKRKLFEKLLKEKKKNMQAIIACYNQYGANLASWLSNQRGQVTITTIGDGFDYSLKTIQPRWQGYSADVESEEESFKLQTSMLGVYNLYNLLTAQLVLEKLGISREKALEQIEKLQPPEGRMEVINAVGNRKIVIDYAHTPDSLEASLTTLYQLNPVRVICVFGCGGDRDKTKRAIMGKVASKNSDFTIITNDNPRSEDQQSIVNDIKEGFESSNYIVVFERERAIHVGLQMLGIQEVLLIAGKGHEDYQIIADSIVEFSDHKWVKKLLKRMDYTEK